MLRYTADYSIRLVVDMGEWDSHEIAERHAEGLATMLRGVALPYGYEQTDWQVTLTGCGTEPKERVRARSFETALRGFVQAYGDLIDKVASEEHIPQAMRDAKARAVEVLQGQAKKPV